MKKILKNLLLVSVLTLALAACAEEENTAPATAQSVLGDFMAKFNQMEPTYVARGNENNTFTAEIENKRQDKKDASVFCFDTYLAGFGVNTNEPSLSPSSNNPIISYGKKEEVNFDVVANINSLKPNETKSAVCSLLTSKEEGEMKNFFSQIESPDTITAEQVHSFISTYVEPNLIKVNYSQKQ